MQSVSIGFEKTTYGGKKFEIEMSNGMIFLLLIVLIMVGLYTLAPQAEILIPLIRGDYPVEQSTVIEEQCVMELCDKYNIRVIIEPKETVPIDEVPEFIQYEVQPGDTLIRLGRYFDVSINEVIRLNDILNPNLIYVGQILIIPNPQMEKGE